MSTTSSVSVQGQVGQQVETGYDAYAELDTGDFLELIIAELQNQDPMNPTDTSDMLNQFNQIREIASNDKLTETLEGVLLGPENLDGKQPDWKARRRNDRRGRQNNRASRCGDG